MEQTSRLTICYGYSIHTQAKAQLLRPPSLFWRNLAKRTILQCFSCLQLSLSKASAKVRRIFHTAKKIFPHVREKVYLCSAFGTDVARMKRYIYIVLGLVAVGLGALGVVVPGLPTTPFLLLASWLFYRSSPKLQQWLLASWLGKYIRGYQRRGGMTATQKAGAVGVMAVMVLLSTFVFIPEGSVARIIVPVAGAVGALTVVFFVPNAKNDDI